MKHSAYFVALILFVETTNCLQAEKIAGEKWQSRSILNLGMEAMELLPCPFPYFPIPYGCFCGPNIPSTPYKTAVDDFDAVCKEHDACYDAVMAMETCSFWDVYVLGYGYTVNGTEIICDSDQSACRGAVCSCDKVLYRGLLKKINEHGCPGENPGCPE